MNERRRLFEDRFVEGVAHFNARRFWEAHESWEELWLEAESEMHQFLQGLIQLAAAYHHTQRGTLRGAARLFDAALGRLQPFAAGYAGIDRRALIEKAEDDRDAVRGALASDPQGNERRPGTVSVYPSIELSRSWMERIPEPW